MKDFEEKIIDENDNPAKSALAFFMLAAFTIIGGWICKNIFTAYEWEIKGFLICLIGKIINFFSVIFTGEISPTDKLKFSWWTLLFLSFCAVSIYSAFATLISIKSLLKNTFKFFRKFKPRDEIQKKILSNYRNYEDFRNRFKGFDDLTDEAKIAVRNLFSD